MSGRHNRRLACVASAITAGAAAGLPSRGPAAGPREGFGSCWAPLAQQLAKLRAAKAAAVACEDFDEAAQLAQALAVLTPRPRLQEPGAHATTEEQVGFLREHGFLSMKLFQGEQLARLTQAWRRVADPAKAEWEELKARHGGGGERGPTYENSPLSSTAEFAPRGTPFTFRGRVLTRRWLDIPAEDMFAEALMSDGDDILLDLIDHPRMTEVVRGYLGDGAQLAGVSPRIYPKDPCAEGSSYTFWHRDGSKPDGYPSPSDAHDLKVRAQIM